MDWAHSWIEAGGKASFGRIGGEGVIESGVSLCLVLLSLSDCSFCCFMAKPGLCDRPLFSFPGAAFAAASQFVERGGTAVGGRGITESRTGCGRTRGRGFIRTPDGSSCIPPCPLPHPS